MRTVTDHEVTVTIEDVVRMMADNGYVLVDDHGRPSPVLAVEVRRNYSASGESTWEEVGPAEVVSPSFAILRCKWREITPADD